MSNKTIIEKLLYKGFDTYYIHVFMGLRELNSPLWIHPIPHWYRQEIQQKQEEALTEIDYLIP